MKHMITCIAAAMLLSGCGKQDAAPQATPADDAAARGLASVVGKSVQPTDDMAIPAIKAVAVAGQTVTLKGKVMGSAQPFVSGRAVMVIADEATIESCDLNPDDACKTPWDACCVDAPTIQAGTAIVQVVDENGKPLHMGLKGMGGLKELSSVLVSGTVADGSDKDVLIVNADAIDVR